MTRQDRVELRDSSDPASDTHTRTGCKTISFQLSIKQDKQMRLFVLSKIKETLNVVKASLIRYW